MWVIYAEVEGLHSAVPCSGLRTALVAILATAVVRAWGWAVVSTNTWKLGHDCFTSAITEVAFIVRYAAIEHFTEVHRGFRRL